MNIPTGGSPYLKMYEDEYIIPNAAPGHQRGRFELAFSQIGGSVLTGAAFGGTLGTVRGLKLIKDIPTFNAKRTQMLNSVIKGGTATANTFGVIALVYSAIGVGLSLVREDDTPNTIAAAALTGLITLAAFRKRLFKPRTR